MTPREFQIEFERSASYIDEIKEGSIRINSDDVNFFLNEAIHVWLTKKLKINNKGENSGIKRSQRELDEIKDLIVKNASLVEDESLSTLEYKVYTLPTNYLFSLADKTNTTFCGINKTYKNRLYTTESVEEVLEDTHMKTKYNSPVSEIISNKIYVYFDSFTVNSVKLDYIKDFTRIDVITNVNTNINESVHKDIVQIANSLLQSAISSGRFAETIEKNLLTEQINVN